LPVFVGGAALVALLLTYPYGTLTVITLFYLAIIPLSYHRFEHHLSAPGQQPQAQPQPPPISSEHQDDEGSSAGQTKH
jgi:CDP-diacylglycerol--serine O-phosphatidyltransferase